MCWRYAAPQHFMASSTGWRLYPVAVSVVLHAGRDLGVHAAGEGGRRSPGSGRLAVSIFWVTPAMDFLNSLNRRVPARSSRMMRTFQRSLIMARVISTGQGW